MDVELTAYRKSPYRHRKRIQQSSKPHHCAAIYTQLTSERGSLSQARSKYPLSRKLSEAKQARQNSSEHPLRRLRFQFIYFVSKWFCSLLSPLPSIFFLLPLLLSPNFSFAIILSGGPDSYARYPKWVQTFENELKLDFRTNTSNALLLYTDDGNLHGNYFCITIADGRLQLDFRLGVDSDVLIERVVTIMRIHDVAVNDNKWHHVLLFQAWEIVKLQLDDVVKFKVLDQQNFAFGNIQTNSDVFIGGVPNDIHLLDVMSSPLKRYSKTFAGSIKNLVYRLHLHGLTSPEFIEAKGIRQSSEEYCNQSRTIQLVEYCENEGICYSTNQGPQCDCSFTGYEGRKCNKVRRNGELSFFGQEWLGYDVSNSSAATLRSRFENISFSFKTSMEQALMFIQGERASYLHVRIDNGSVIATSKFASTEKRMIRMFNRNNFAQYNDDQWHAVVVIRTLTLQQISPFASVHMTLTVDGVSDEVRQYVPDSRWLTNSYVYIGGVPSNINLNLDMELENFRGCIKKVKYDADVYSINFIQLADQGYGQSVIRSAGDIAFSCRHPNLEADILSFNTGQSYLALPSWNSLSSGSIAFQIRTNENDGLILYHGTKIKHNISSADYMAFELIDGHLYFIINLGSGHVRLQTTAAKINEGMVWHTVTLERLGRSGTVIVDDLRTDFSTPGVKKDDHKTDEPMYVGGVPWSTNIMSPDGLQLPATIWTGTFRLGYIGCLKNFRMNGINSNIAIVYEEQKSNAMDGISYGCSNALNADYCRNSPCKFFSRCENGYATYHCDCASSSMDGPQCDTELKGVQIDEDSSALDLNSLRLPIALQIEAETIECKFRTTDEHGYLLDTSSRNSAHGLSIALIKGVLQLHLNFGTAQHTFKWGKNMGDNRFHIFRIKRRGEKLLLFSDGKWEHSYFLPASSLIMNIDWFTIGRTIIRKHWEKVTVPNTMDREDHFFGVIFKLTFNGYDLLQNMKRKTVAYNGYLLPANEEAKEVRSSGKVKPISITFETSVGRAVFASKTMDSISGSFRVAFRFKTSVETAVILVLISNSANHFKYLLIELINSNIRYTFARSSKIYSAMPSTSMNLSDMQWHNVLVYQIGIEHYLLVDNINTTVSVEENMSIIKGRLYLGGFTNDVVRVVPRLKGADGYRGCISSLRLGGEYIEIFNEAEELVDSSSGCQAESTKCTPNFCLNRGKCVQGWNSARCDCSLTTYVGDRCGNAGTTIIFDSTLQMIYYEYPPVLRPSTMHDKIAIGFQTRQESAVLLSVQCTVDSDFLTVFMFKGNVYVRYNLGTRDHTVGILDTIVNDDKYHTLAVIRSRVNLTLFLDDHHPIQYNSKGALELFTLNMQWRISIGASFNTYHKLFQTRRKRESLQEIFDPFHGRITGVSFNNLMILDFFLKGSPLVHQIGSPQSTISLSTLDQLSLMDTTKNERMNNADDISEITTDEDSLITTVPSSCFDLEEGDCEIDESDSTGLITPVFIHRLTTTAQPSKTTHRLSFTTTPTSNNTFRHRPIPTDKATPTDVIISERPQTKPTIIYVKDETSLSDVRKSTTMPVFTESLIAGGTSTAASIEARKNLRTESDIEDFWSDIGAPSSLMLDRKTKIAANTQIETKATTVAIRTTTNSYVKPKYITSSVDISEYTNTNRLKNQELITSTKTALKSAGHSKQSTKPSKKIAYTTLPRTTSTAISTITEARRRTTNIPLQEIYAVRPTTPMGVLMATTSKTPSTSTDFPRTALISIASLSVIIIIAIVVFCVFRCRQSAPSADHYEMTCNGKQSGYTPISSETSPEMARNEMMHLSTSRPFMQGMFGNQLNGYQPIKGSVVPNSRNCVAGRNNNDISNGRRKEFKEWYV